MRTPDDHLRVLGLLAQGAHCAASRTASSRALEVVRLSEGVRAAQRAYFRGRASADLESAKSLERHLDQLLGRQPQAQQLELSLGGAP